MVMRVKRPLVPGIIPPCLITCVCIPVETGRAPSHLLKMVFKLPSDDGRRSTLRLYMMYVEFTSDNVMISGIRGHFVSIAMSIHQK